MSRELQETRSQLAESRRQREGAAPAAGLGRAWTPAPAAWFILDQLAHLAVIWLAWAIWLAGTAPIAGWATEVGAVTAGSDPTLLRTRAVRDGEGNVVELIGTVIDVTDTAKTIPVVYKGILPDLFKEGKGVVAQGQVGDDGVFVAREVQRDFLDAFLAAWNKDPKPFVWTATVESITEKLSRCRRTLEKIQPGCTSPQSRKQKK